MNVNNSRLSDPKYGYDFVVSTCQDSISSLMQSAMYKADSAKWYFFRANPGDKVEVYSQSQAMARTNNVDPLNVTQCPDDMETTDPNYQTLYAAGFAFACDYTIGFPIKNNDKEPPPGLTLLNDPDHVLLSVFFLDISLAQCRDEKGNKMWHRSTRNEDDYWYMTLKLSIAQKPVPDLRDEAYYKQNPSLADEIERRLQQNKRGPHRLLKVALSWEDFAVQGSEFPGIPDGTYSQAVMAATYAVERFAELDCLPPLCLFDADAAAAAAANSRNGVTPVVTACDRQVTTNPDSVLASTLDVLCMASARPMPPRPHPSFGWRWMEATDITGGKHGTSSINGSVIADFVRTSFEPLVQKTFARRFICNVDVDDIVYLFITSEPDATKSFVQSCPIAGAPDVLLRLQYTAADTAAKAGVQLSVNYRFTLEVECKRKNWAIMQDFEASVEVAYGDASVPYMVKAHNRDNYTMSVDSKDRLVLKYVDFEARAYYQEFKPHETWSRAFAGSAKTCVCSFYDYIKQNLEKQSLEILPISMINNFVFPCGQPYSFADPRFSDWSDLLCDVYYTDRAERESELEDAEHTYPGESLRLTSSADLMQNYVPGKIVNLLGTGGRFRALQTSRGDTLFFSMDSDSFLNVIEEKRTAAAKRKGQVADDDTSPSGWILTRISPSPVTMFDVNQDANTGTISLAFVQDSGGTDVLYFSRGKSSQDLSWIKDQAKNWSAIEFDAMDKAKPHKLHMDNIMFAEAVREHLIVDIDRSQGGDDRQIDRYYINSQPSKDKRHWEHHAIPGDLSAGRYFTRIGRAGGQPVDGIYTSGTVFKPPSTLQLCYQPISNPFGHVAPPPRWLELPEGHVSPTAMPIATVRNVRPHMGALGITDLYAIGNSTMYRWDAVDQADGSCAQALLKNPLFQGTEVLLGMAQDSVATLWGLTQPPSRNGGGVLYTLSCKLSEVADPTKWSRPVPIALDIERLEAYVNVQDGGNTIFAYEGNGPKGGGRVKKLMKLPGTRVWKEQEIVLPAPAVEESVPFLSYTTTLSVSTSTGQPAAGCKVSISTGARTPVYINGDYRILDGVGVDVKADESGTVTVVEATKHLHATELTVRTGESFDSTIIKPYDAVYNKLGDLDTKDKLRAKSVPVALVAGGVDHTTSYRKLVPEDVPQEHVEAAAGIISQLRKAHDDGLLGQLGGGGHGGDDGIFDDFWDVIRAVGEAIFKFGKRIVLKIVKWGDKGLKIVLEFLEQTYEAIIETVQEVIAAIQWVIHQIVETVEDLIKYLQVLFEWEDIHRTKKVLEKVVLAFVQHQVDGLASAKGSFDKYLDDASRSVDEWAHSLNSNSGNDWADKLGPAAQRRAADSAKNPANGQTSASMTLARHFQKHWDQIEPTKGGDAAVLYIPASVVDELLAALPDPSDDATLQHLYDELVSLAKDFTQLSVTQVLKRLAGILANAALTAVKALVDALFEVLKTMSSAVLDVLKTPVRIPILSDILRALGVPDFTILDLILYVAAASYTIVYKLANGGSPPFGEGDVDAASLNSWDDFTAWFQRHPTLRTSLYYACHACGGFLYVVAAPFHGIEAGAPTGAPRWITLTPAVIGGTAGVLKTIVDIISPRYGVANTCIVGISGLIGAVSFVYKIAFALAGASMVKVARLCNITFKDARGGGAIVQAMFVVPRLVVAGYHFYELSGKPADMERAAAIVGEVSNLTDCVSVLSYAVAVNVDEETTKAAAIVGVVVGDVATGGLQIAESALRYDAENTTAEYGVLGDKSGKMRRRVTYRGTMITAAKGGHGTRTQYLGL